MCQSQCPNSFHPVFPLGVHYLQNIKRTHAVQCQKNKQHNKKWAEDLKRHSSEKDTQMAKKQVIRLNITIREMQINAAMSCLPTPSRMAIIKKSTSNRCWRGCGEKETLLSCWWECKLAQCLQRKVWRCETY